MQKRLTGNPIYVAVRSQPTINPKLRRLLYLRADQNPEIRIFTCRVGRPIILCWWGFKLSRPRAHPESTMNRAPVGLKDRKEEGRKG